MCTKAFFRVYGVGAMAANHVTESQPTSGLDFKASADREEQYLFNILLHVLTTHQGTIPM